MLVTNMFQVAFTTWLLMVLKVSLLVHDVEAQKKKLNPFKFLENLFHQQINYYDSLLN